MLNFIIRKTILNDMTKDAQDFIVKMFDKRYIVMFCCFIMIFCLATLPYNVVIITFLFIEFSKTEEIIICLGLAIYIMIQICIMKLYNGQMFLLYHSLFQKIYFRLYTTKGKALSSREFEVIKSKKPILYDVISNGECKGDCYSVCFDILKILKQGTIKFIAAKAIIPGEESDGREYTMHVLYVNNGWVFDTYNQRQMPLNEILDRYNAKLYKDFNFDDVKELLYSDFRDKHYIELKKWCDENDVYQKWSKF